MRIKILIISIYILLSLNIFAQDEIEEKFNQFSIDICFDPIIKSVDFSRGLNISWSRYLFKNFSIGAQTRFINQDYSLISFLTGYDLELNRSYIPLQFSIGLKLKDVKELEDLNFVISGSIGYEFKVDETWRYTIKGDYTLELYNDKDYFLLVMLGVKYLF